MIAGGTAGVGFVPTQYGNCVLWLRADTGVTTSVSSITAWADQSGAGNSLTQGVATPTLVTNVYNGQPCARFVSASSQYLIKTATNLFGSGAYSIFIACKWAAGLANDYLFSSSATNADGNMLFQNGANRAILHAGVTAFAGNNYNSTNGEIWAALRGAAAAPTLRINGDVQLLGASNATMNNPGGTAALVLGAVSNAAVLSGFFGGDIMEVIAYAALRTDAEVAAIQKYLKSRYALP